MTHELIKKEAAKFFPPKRYPFGLAFSQDDVVAFAKHCVDKATGWRKMEDEKPTPNDCKHGVGCLVLRPVTNGKSIELIVDYAWYYAGQFTRQSGRTYKEDGYRDDITHWQPLPQPPKAKNDRLSRQTI